MKRFTIDWTTPSTGDEFTVSYVYDGCGIQKEYDLVGWVLKCLRFGKEQGFKYGRNVKLIN